jgi:hypothetical protein
MLRNSWISAKITRAASISTPGHSSNLKKYTITYPRSYRSSFQPIQDHATKSILLK